MMKTNIHLSVQYCLFPTTLVLVLLIGTSSSTVIEDNCRQVGDLRRGALHALCVTTLKSDPRSTNLHTMKDVTSLLTQICIDHANRNVAELIKLPAGPRAKTDPKFVPAVNQCFSEYRTAINVDFVGAREKIDGPGDWAGATNLLQLGFLHVSNCEEAFAYIPNPKDQPLVASNKKLRDLALITTLILPS